MVLGTGLAAARLMSKEASSSGVVVLASSSLVFWNVAARRSSMRFYRCVSDIERMPRTSSSSTDLRLAFVMATSQAT
jgi:hypothetical protein